MAKKRYGMCSLCGKYGYLTYEHIPPKSAFNSKPVQAVTGYTLLTAKNSMPWDISGLHYKNLQQGMGRYSLCSKCNNNTGEWYGKEYARVAKAAHMAIIADASGFEIKEFYPLRFVKQVLSLFCSINTDCPNFKMRSIRELVLNKQELGLDKKKYKLCMYFTRSNLAKQIGISAIMNIQTGTFTELSEITSYPLGFALYFDPIEGKHYTGFDITGFADFRYEESGSATFPLYLLEMNSWIPADYRTQDDIRLCVEKSENWEREHGMDTV